MKTSPKRLDVSDLWSPGDSLPSGPTLRAIAQRCGPLWGLPDFADRVSIGYNPRLRTTLGRAMLEENRVELNVHLLRAHPEELLATLVHELAHLAVRMLYGNAAAHGLEFKTLMAAAGVSAATTHKLDTDSLGLRRRRYAYLHRCGDCGMMFIARKPRRDCYCKSCGPKMSWNIFRAPDTAAGRKKLKEIMESTA